jgi:hypothetical protein
MVAQISSVGQADLAATGLSQTVKLAVARMLNSGLAGGAALPTGLDPGTLGTIQAVLNDSIAQGTRWASLTAAVFVSLGAVSSLFIPNPKPVERAKTKALEVPEPQQLMPHVSVPNRALESEESVDQPNSSERMTGRVKNRPAVLSK